MTGKVSVVSDYAAISGRFLDFYLGEWANDSAPVRRALPFIRPTLIYIRPFLVAPATSLKLLRWQVPLLCDIVSSIVWLRLFIAFQREGRIMA